MNQLDNLKVIYKNNRMTPVVTAVCSVDNSWCWLQLIWTIFGMLTLKFHLLITPMTSDLRQQVQILHISHMDSWIKFLHFSRLPFKINMYWNVSFQQPVSGAHLDQISGRYTDFGRIIFWRFQNGLILLNWIINKKNIFSYKNKPQQVLPLPIFSIPILIFFSEHLSERQEKMGRSA